MSTQPQAVPATATNNMMGLVSDQAAWVYSQFRGQPLVLDQLDIQDEPLYDNVTYAAGTGVVNNNTSQWFTNVGPNSGKNNPADTNLRLANQLPVPEAFAIMGIRLCPSENVLGLDWLSIINGFAFTLWLNTKQYNTGNIRHYVAGIGTYASTTLGDTQWLANGFPGLNAAHLLSLPLVITNALTFFAQLLGATPYTLNAGGTGLRFLLELVGLHARAVA